MLRGHNHVSKFCREYGKPGGVKLSVTFDALNRISGKHRALFSSFLGDMVREHIGLQILSWKKVGPEARNKLWDEITRYFDVDLTVRKLVMNRLGQLLRNFRRKLRQTYILPNQDTPSKLNEVSARVKKEIEQDEEPTHGKPIVLEREGKQRRMNIKMMRLERGDKHVRKGRLIKRMWEWSDIQEKVNLDAARRELRSKELSIKESVQQMSQTEVSPVEIHPINSSADEEGGTTIVGCDHNDASIRKEMQKRKLLNLWELSKKRLINVPKGFFKSRFPIQRKCVGTTTSILWHLKKTTIIAEGTVYKSDGKIMLHNKALPKDCYKVSIDKSLVDAAFIPDVGSNGCTTVLDAVGGFVAWPKNQVVLDPKATPPSTIQMITGENKTAPKVQMKRKEVYVSSDAMQKEANKKRSQKALFWATAKVKTVNGEHQIQALVDKQKTTSWNEFSSTMASAITFYVTPSHTKKVFANMKRPCKGFSGRVTPLFSTMMVQATEDMGEDSAAPSNSHSTPIISQPLSSKPQNKKSKRKQRKDSAPTVPTTEETPDEAHVSTPSYDLPQSGEDSMQLSELMNLCTSLQEKVLNLEKAKTAQAKEISNLEKRVKQLEKKRKLKTPRLKRLRKISSTSRVESYNDASLGAQEDASKQGRKIVDLDADAEVILVDVTQEMNDDNLMFDTSMLEEHEKDVAEKEVSAIDPVTTTGEVVTTANVEVTTVNASTTTIDELTLAQTLIEIKAAKPKAVTSDATTTTTTRPKVRGVVVQEPSEFKTTSSSLQASQLLQDKDKGKGIMVEPEVPLKKKDQTAMQKEEEANIALLESWDNTQAMMDADFQLAQQMQTEEQEQLSIEEKSKLFVELLEKRKKHFAALRAQEKRSKPPTKAQKRNIKCSKTKAEGSSKRAGDELEQEKTKKQKGDDDQEEAEMKRHIEIVKDDEVPFETRDTQITTPKELEIQWILQALEGPSSNHVFKSNVQDSDSDVEEDTKSSQEFLVDLKQEYLDRTLLANQEKIVKKIWKLVLLGSRGKSKEKLICCGIRSLSKDYFQGVSWLSLADESLWGRSDARSCQGKKSLLKRNIVHALGGKPKRKGKQSPKDIVFLKVEDSPIGNESKYISNSESVMDKQDHHLLVPKLLGARPILGQMAHLVASIILDNARSYVIQSAFLTQGTVSNIPIVFSWSDNIRPEVSCLLFCCVLLVQKVYAAGLQLLEELLLSEDKDEVLQSFLVERIEQGNE
ncbi:hypothetical protein Tco_0277970 [Tanacetum coccineum]